MNACQQLEEWSKWLRVKWICIALALLKIKKTSTLWINIVWKQAWVYKRWMKVMQKWISAWRWMKKINILKYNNKRTKNLFAGRGIVIMRKWRKACLIKLTNFKITVLNPKTKSNIPNKTNQINSKSNLWSPNPWRRRRKKRTLP